MNKTSKQSEKIDLNLLPIFDAVYTTGSIKKTAELLSVSPSAVSQSITKLKMDFSDPLFLRDKNKLVATTIAHNLHKSIKSSLHSLTNDIEIFRNTSKYNKLVISSSPYIGMRFMTVLSAYLSDINSTYHIEYDNSDNDLEKIEKLLLLKQVDLAFGLEEIANSSISSIELMNENIIAVCAKNHPRIDQKISNKELMSEKFVSIKTGNKSLVPYQLYVEKKMGIRDFNFSCSSLFIMASYISHSDSICFMPTSFFEQFRESFSLKKVSIDFDLPNIKIYMHFNKIKKNNPSFNFLLEYIINKTHI